MKTKLLFIVILFLPVFIFASEVNVITKLETAKVFLSGVELTHSASANIPGKGNYELVFEGFASNINENSIQVSASGDVLILSVKSRNNYLKANEKSKEVITLEDSLKMLNMQKSKQQNEKDIYYMEIELLNANKQLTGNEKTASVKEIQQFAKFYTDRLKEIKNSVINIDLKLSEIEKDINRITNQLNEINKRRNLPSTEIVVNVASSKAGKSEFKISYLNYSAGWTPAYDIRAKDISSPVTLNYKAEVFQNSGLNWKDAQIILSTRNPRENNNKPELYTWYLDFEQNIGFMRERSAGKPMMKTMQQNESVIMDVATAPSMEEFIKISETQLAVEFIADINYTIPSDNKQHSIALREYELPARFEYYAAPKFDGNAFLVAYFNEWKELNLLPGQANIYFENSYVGQSVINPFTTEKELTLSMGTDKNIVIERKLLKEFTEDKFLSSDIERQFAYEIKIKNNKKSDVKLILEEPYPISKNEEIRVELINSAGAEVDKVKGILKWVIDLKTSEDISKQFVYSVRYPADKVIPGL